MPREAKQVTVYCRREAETMKAVKISQGDDEYWIPLSQITELHFDGKEEGSIVCSKWIADEKELEYTTV